jgi:hypothetical protein
MRRCGRVLRASQVCGSGTPANVRRVQSATLVANARCELAAHVCQSSAPFQGRVQRAASATFAWVNVHMSAPCEVLFVCTFLARRMQAQTETEAKTNEAAVALGSAAVDPLAIPEGVVCDGKGMCVLAEEPECIPSTPDGEDCLVPGPLTTPQQYWGPRLILLLCCVLYGTNFAFGRLLNDSLDASVVSGLRFSLATVCLSPFLKDIEKELIRPAFICSLFVAMGYIGQSVSLETISAGKSGFICSLAVITCPLLEAVFDGRRIGAPLLAAIALSIAGVGALELGDVEPPGIGDLWAMGQPIGFGAAFWKTVGASCFSVAVLLLADSCLLIFY